MTHERRYREEEIKRIFEIATAKRTPDSRPASAYDSLTLDELREIGRQVGIRSDRITEAAAAIDAESLNAPGGVPTGIPLTVRRTTPLPRAPTEREWEILLTEIRETFDAPGAVSVTGGIYSWTNGNLHVFIEPTASGYRLRMGTRKGSATALGVAGLTGLGWGTLIFIGLAATGDLGSADAIIAPTLLSLLGASSLGTALLRLPGWARTRYRQMGWIASRAQALLEAEPGIANLDQDSRLEER